MKGHWEANNRWLHVSTYWKCPNNRLMRNNRMRVSPLLQPLMNSVGWLLTLQRETPRHTSPPDGRTHHDLWRHLVKKKKKLTKLVYSLDPTTKLQEVEGAEERVKWYNRDTSSQSQHRVLSSSTNKSQRTNLKKKWRWYLRLQMPWDISPCCNI